MGFIEELKSKNFSIYAQWYVWKFERLSFLPLMFGLASIVLLVVAGVLAFIYNIIFAILAWVIAFLLIFVEIPLCTKICPTSPKFDAFTKKFENHFFRTIGYLIFATLMFVSTIISRTILIAPGVTLLLAGICYGIATAKLQRHASSSITGGTGV
ncbi:9081_t:CDS:2 [Acaulospora morrowiae]|uniref:9081_t:CDS:1 n=1 Tax=Acaulospora morrowiae TaxID=94023 RepID=A0A9N9HLQ2_9GLOM|nr:9081_t:CDS:2 [Acaulospora morrowiae]